MKKHKKKVTNTKDSREDPIGVTSTRSCKKNTTGNPARTDERVPRNTDAE